MMKKKWKGTAMANYRTRGNPVTACPICRKPFEEDAEVGPVPACECGDRGKVDLEECPFPTDNYRMMNAKWSGPDHG
jgi:hypothetical protein